MNSPFATNANRVFNITFTREGTSARLDLAPTLPAWGDKCDFEKYNYWFVCGGFCSTQALSATDKSALEKQVCAIAIPNLQQTHSCADMEAVGQDIAGEYNNLVYLCILDDIDDSRLNELSHIKNFPVLLNTCVGQSFMTAPFVLNVEFLILTQTSFAQPTITNDLDLLYVFTIFECLKS
jgi:hypothetical protein